MVKLSILLTRRPDLTHQEFVEYWTGKHTPLLAARRPVRTPLRAASSDG
jgi:hypothetical protein